MKHSYSSSIGSSRHFSQLLLLVGVFLLFPIISQAQTQDFSTRQNRLKQHIYYLASDSLKGRSAGSDDAHKAAQYIIQQFENIGLKPLYNKWIMPFHSPNSNADSPMKYQNVVGVIEGSDSTLKNEYIILGAHYDHLGVKNNIVYNGADDNASGTAAIIETARILIEHRNELKRSVIIVAFDAEEIGLFGSTAFAEKLWTAYDNDNEHVSIFPHGLLNPITNVKMMMSIDMVGWLKEGKELSLSGTGTMKNSKELLSEIAKQMGMPINTNRFETSIFTATDTEPFAKYGVPTLAVTTGTKSPYHKPEDDADLIDYEGLDRVVQYIAQITLTMAKQPNLQSTGRVAPKHTEHLPLFELGATAGISLNQLHFRDAKCISTSRPGTQVGLTGRFNINSLVLQLDCQYNYLNANYPNEGIASSHIYRQNLLMVPLMVLLQNKTGMPKFYIGLGPYYGHLFNAGNGINPNQYGLQYGFGFRMGKINFGYIGQFQFNSIYSDNNHPYVNNRCGYLSIGYYFW